MLGIQRSNVRPLDSLKLTMLQKHWVTPGSYFNIARPYTVKNSQRNKVGGSTVLKLNYIFCFYI